MFEENENNHEDPRYLRVDLEGKDKTKWAKFRQKLIDSFFKALEGILDLEINVSPHLHGCLKRVVSRLFLR